MANPTITLPTSRRPRPARPLVTLLLATALAAPLQAQPLDDADEIIRRANLSAFYAGDDGRAEARMQIVDGQGRQQLRQFHLLRKDRADGGDQEFMVFFSRPSDVRGTVFRVAKHPAGDDDRWLYLPGLDLVKRIAAGDKRTSFVGSHFFYEDVSGRNIAEDRYRLLASDNGSYLVEGTPIKPQTVEFAYYHARIDQDSWLPVKVEYFDTEGRVYRRVEAERIETIEGYPTVVQAKVSDLRSGGHTTLQFRNLDYNLGLPESVFSERSLRNPPSDWLRP